MQQYARVTELPGEAEETMAGRGELENEPAKVVAGCTLPDTRQPPCTDGVCAIRPRDRPLAFAAIHRRRQAQTEIPLLIFFFSGMNHRAIDCPSMRTSHIRRRLPPADLAQLPPLSIERKRAPEIWGKV
jgi:hypothetical protein